MAGGAIGLRPLEIAGGAFAMSVESVPGVAAGAGPAVVLFGFPTAAGAADAGAFWLLLLVLGFFLVAEVEASSAVFGK